MQPGVNNRRGFSLAIFRTFSLKEEGGYVGVEFLFKDERGMPRRYIE
jgi:hypothetical protein